MKGLRARSGFVPPSEEASVKASLQLAPRIQMATDEERATQVESGSRLGVISESVGRLGNLGSEKIKKYIGTPIGVTLLRSIAIASIAEGSARIPCSGCKTRTTEDMPHGRDLSTKNIRQLWPTGQRWTCFSYW